MSSHSYRNGGLNLLANAFDPFTMDALSAAKPNFMGISASSGAAANGAVNGAGQKNSAAASAAANATATSAATNAQVTFSNTWYNLWYGLMYLHVYAYFGSIGLVLAICGVQAANVHTRLESEYTMRSPKMSALTQSPFALMLTFSGFAYGLREGVTSMVCEIHSYCTACWFAFIYQAIYGGVRNCALWMDRQLLQLLTIAKTSALKRFVLFAVSLGLRNNMTMEALFGLNDEKANMFDNKAAMDRSNMEKKSVQNQHACIQKMMEVRKCDIQDIVQRNPMASASLDINASTDEISEKKPPPRTKGMGSLANRRTRRAR